jgi:prepilin-type N-terminal cleavage/methylation domain-containing protein/prepilin-type processing-associated H-X9-DG protein
MNSVIHQQPRSRRGSAFTLIELLVVLAIIVVLAGLLLPALAKGKARSSSARCKNTLRQVGLQMTVYVNEYGAFPTAFPLLNSWEFFMADSGFVMRDPRPKGEQYAYNAFGVTWDGDWWGLGGKGNSIKANKEDYAAPVREGDILNPSAMVSVGDGMKLSPRGYYAFDGTVGRITTRRDYPGEITDHMRKVSARAKVLHGETANMIYVDGHIEGFTFAKLFLGTNDSIFSMFHRDGQPHLEKLR